MDIYKYAGVIYAHYEENIIRKLNDTINNQNYSCDKFETFDILCKCVDMPKEICEIKNVIIKYLLNILA